MTAASAGWTRAVALPDQELIELRFTDLLELQLGPEDVELLLCDLISALGSLYDRVQRWPDYLRLINQYAVLLTLEPGMQCDPLDE